MTPLYRPDSGAVSAVNIYSSSDLLRLVLQIGSFLSGAPLVGARASDIGRILFFYPLTHSGQVVLFNIPSVAESRSPRQYRWSADENTEPDPAAASKSVIDDLNFMSSG